MMFRNAVVGFALLIAGASAHASDIFRVDLTVSRGGAVVGTPSVRVEPDKIADLTLTPPDRPATQAVRVSVSVAPGKQAGTVAVHLMLFDRPTGEWTLRSESDVIAWVHKEATLKVAAEKGGANAPPIEVALKVTPEASTPVALAGEGT